MKYIKLFEQFINESISQEELVDFVNKFDLIDKQEYNKDLKISIVDIIKMYRKGKTVEEIASKYNDLKQIMKSAYDFYNQELLRYALPQGDLQDPNPQIPIVNIEWGKKTN